MKRIFTALFLYCACYTYLSSQSIGIGTPTPHPSAAFEIDASDKGLLISRMSSSLRMMIPSPAEGLIVFDTTTKTFWFYNSGWIELKKDNLGDHTATQDLDMDGQRIMNLDDPVVISDAATKLYVDNHTDADADASNELQTLSISNDTIYLTSGGSVALPDGSGAFENNSGLIRNPGSNQNDFIFGNQDLPINGSAMSERFFFFDEDKAAFRVGRLQNSNFWSPDSLGDHSIAMGYNVKAKGNTSLALGNLCTATGDHSIALGKSANAGGEHSIAIGLGTNAEGEGSRAFGFGCRSRGTNATSIGYSNHADGDESFAIGNATQADGLNATSMGKITEANGDYSTATGFNTKANGDISFAMGHGTRPATYSSVAFGQFNVGSSGSTNSWVLSEPVLEVGIGLSSLSRENALTILKNGTISFKDYTFPNADGTSNQILTTNGSGQLIWTNAVDNSNTNELLTSVTLANNTLSISDAGNTYNLNLGNVVHHHIEDDNGDTKVEFNNINDKILFTAQGATIAKMEMDSMFIDGHLQIGSGAQSKVYLGSTFMQGGTSTHYSIKNIINNTDNLIINDQGEIGIGLSNPQEALDVFAENDFDGIRIQGSATNDHVQLKLDNNSISGKEYVLRSTGSNASQGAGKFLIRDNDSAQSRFAIDANGKIGIGTVNPDEKLHVNGAIKSNDLSGSGTSTVWVDTDGKLVRGDNNVSHMSYVNYTDFAPGSGLDIFIHPLEGVYMTAGTGPMYASLGDIPDGATITDVKVYYYDNETGAGEDMDFGIQYYDGFSGLLQSHSLGSSSNGGNTRNSSTYSGVNFTLDRNTYDYSFVISSSDWGTALKVFSIEITYTL